MNNDIGDTAIPSQLGSTLTGATANIYSSYQPIQDYTATQISFEYTLAVGTSRNIYTAPSNGYIRLETQPTESKASWGSHMIDGCVVASFGTDNRNITSIIRLYIPKGSIYSAVVSNSALTSMRIAGAFCPAVITG